MTSSRLWYKGSVLVHYNHTDWIWNWDDGKQSPFTFSTNLTVWNAPASGFMTAPCVLVAHPWEFEEVLFLYLFFCFYCVGITRSASLQKSNECFFYEPFKQLLVEPTTPPLIPPTTPCFTISGCQPSLWKWERTGGRLLIHLGALSAQWSDELCLYLSPDTHIYLWGFKMCECGY